MREKKTMQLQNKIFKNFKMKLIFLKIKQDCLYAVKGDGKKIHNFTL